MLSSNFFFALLLMIGEIEQNPGNFVEVENTDRFMYWLWEDSEVGNVL